VSATAFSTLRRAIYSLRSKMSASMLSGSSEQLLDHRQALQRVFAERGIVGGNLRKPTGSRLRRAVR